MKSLNVLIMNLKRRTNRWVWKYHVSLWIYGLALLVDTWRNKVSYYKFETAPYCGNHYNGHYGWLTESHFHEGDGGMHATLWPIRIGITEGGGSQQSYWQVLPYLTLKRWWKGRRSIWVKGRTTNGYYAGRLVRRRGQIVRSQLLSVGPDGLKTNSHTFHNN